MEWRTNRADVTCDTPSQCPITGRTDIRLPGFLLVRILLWLLVFAAFPLSVTAARLSFKLEVLGRTIPAALPAERCMPLAERVLVRLEAAEQKESDPWLRDDIRIAWITILEASRGNSQPHIDATYRVLGLHPDKVWQAILDRRAALIGHNELPLETGLPAKRPYRKECERRVASPTTCVNGDSLNTHTRQQNISEIHDGNSGVRDAHACVASDRVKLQNGDQAEKARRRALGVSSGPIAPRAGVAAPAVQTIPPKKSSKSVRTLAQEKGII